MEELKTLRWYKNLNSPAGRVTAGAFLIEGVRAVGQLIAYHPEDIIEILANQEMAPKYRGFNVRALTERQVLSISSTKTPQGVIALVRLPGETYSDDLPENPSANLLLLEDVQDPGNVGTLIRTASAFDFSAVILSEKCADPFSPKCAQSSAGSVLSIAIRRTKNYLSLVENLKSRGYLLVSADLSGIENPEIITTSKKMVMALGNEASGMSQALLDISDYRVRIPINDHKVESLNVAACGAVFMYLSRKKDLKYPEHF